MEKIIPIAGATGAHSFAPTEADPPPLVDQDQDSDPSPSLATSHPPTDSSRDRMDVDATITTLSVNIPQPPATKRQRLLGDGDGDSSLQSTGRSSSSVSIHGSVPTAEQKRMRKGKGKATVKTSSDHSAEFSASLAGRRSSSTPFMGAASTSQRVNKITPAAALVELHGSVDGMTQAILAAAQPPTWATSATDKAIVRCQDAVRLVQERDDGLSILEKAALIIFFGTHATEADMYIALNDDQLRQEVIKQWIKSQA